MMIGGGTRTLRSALGSLLIASLVAAQGLQAAAARDCPHHGGDAHAHGTDAGAPSGGPASTGHHAGPAPHNTDDSRPHDSPCDCLGPCGASAALQEPPTPAESGFAQIVPRRLAEAVAGDRAPTPRTLPFFLPFPNAPPA